MIITAFSYSLTLEPTLHFIHFILDFSWTSFICFGIKVLIFTVHGSTAGSRLVCGTARISVDALVFCRVSVMLKEILHILCTLDLDCTLQSIQHGSTLPPSAAVSFPLLGQVIDTFERVKPSISTCSNTIRDSTFSSLFSLVVPHLPSLLS